MFIHFTFSFLPLFIFSLVKAERAGAVQPGEEKAAGRP